MTDLKIQEGCFIHDSGTLTEAFAFACSRGPQGQEWHAQMHDTLSLTCQ